MNVSVVIRTNGPEQLFEIIRAIGVQRTQHTIVDVLIVDCGSNLDTEHLRLLEQVVLPTTISVVKYDRTIFSYGHSLNLGLKNAVGDIVVSITGHSVPVTPEWIERLLEPFQDQLVAGVCGAQISHRRSNFLERAYRTIWYNNRMTSPRVRAFNAANCAIRRDLWEVVPFDEDIDICEDRHWARQLRKKGFHIHFEINAPVYHSHYDEISGSLAYFWRMWRAMALALMSNKKQEFNNGVNA